jgi:hypothetical protein
MSVDTAIGALIFMTLAVLLWRVRRPRRGIFSIDAGIDWQRHAKVRIERKATRFRRFLSQFRRSLLGAVEELAYYLPALLLIVAIFGIAYGIRLLVIDRTAWGTLVLVSAAVLLLARYRWRYYAASVRRSPGKGSNYLGVWRIAVR